MFLKKLTIFLLPDGTKRVRQFRIPVFLPIVLMLFFFLSMAFSLWIIWDYHGTRAAMTRLAQLEKENAFKQEQLVHLARRIDKFTREMCDLREFDQKLRAMVNEQTTEDSADFKGIGGSDPVLLDPGEKIKETHQDLVRAMHRSLNDLENDIVLGQKYKREIHKFLENQKILLASTPSIWPTKGWLSSRFGYRISPFTGEKEFHKGIDISARMGAPIVSSADGIVSFVGWERGYGRVLTIKHGYGLVTKYAHLKRTLVKKGQYVKRGETIALVGKSGRTTGSHLHYEVRLNSVPVNPLRYILN